MNIEAESISFKIIEFQTPKRSTQANKPFLLSELLSEHNIPVQSYLKDQTTMSPDLKTNITVINELDIVKFSIIDEALSQEKFAAVVISEHHHSDEEEYYLQLNRRILDKSIAKASSLAKSSNMKVGELISITEETYQDQSYGTMNLNKSIGWHTYLGEGYFDNTTYDNKIMHLQRTIRVKYQLVD